MVSEIAAAISENLPAASTQSNSNHGTNSHSPSANARNDYTAAAVAVQKILKRKRGNGSD